MFVCARVFPTACYESANDAQGTSYWHSEKSMVLWYLILFVADSCSGRRNNLRCPTTGLELVRDPRMQRQVNEHM